MKTSVQQIFEDAGIVINGRSPWDLLVKDKRLWRRLALHGSMGLGEAYMDGWWEAEAIDKLIFRLLRHDQSISQERFPRRLWGIVQSYLVNLQGLPRAFQVGEKHYDIGNELYRGMLGEDMVYSCGYWQEGASSLEEAQRAKLDLVCRKIGLEPDMRVLDIGCGWGSFCKFAAENYGADVVGLTVSRQQAEHGRRICEGLPVEIRYEDYRNYGGAFDRLVSIGMFEHVGPRNYATFMNMAQRCLYPEGLFLLHTIGSNVSYRSGNSWITRYIFPNGHLPSLRQLGASLEGRFVAEDLHNFGADYDRTLMAWERNFREIWPAIKERYGDRFYRMWRYYLLCCAGAFRARHIQVWQLVLSQTGVPGGYRRPVPNHAEYAMEPMHKR